jgi:hypothetical protein
MHSRVTSAEYELLTEEADDDPRLLEARALTEKARAWTEKAMTASVEDISPLLHEAHDLLTDFLLHHPEQFYDPERHERLRAFADEKSDHPRWAEMEAEHMLWLFVLDHDHGPTSIEDFTAWKMQKKPKRLTELTRMDLQDIFDKMIASGYAVKVASMQ